MADTPSAKRKLGNMSPNKNDMEISVGTMAVTELMTLMSTLMDDKLKNIPTKQDIDEIKTNVNDLGSKIDHLKTENEVLKNEIKQLRDEKEKDHYQIMYLQDYVKRNNVVFKGMPSNNSLEGAVKECCKDNLKLTKEIKILSTKKLYERDEKIGVIAELSSGEMVKEIFKNTKNLAGTKIILERDLNSDKQKDKRVFLEMKKLIIDMNKDHRISVRNDRMKIENNWFWWNKNKQLICGKQDGVETLKKIFGDTLNSISLNYNEILTNLNSKNPKKH